MSDLKMLTQKNNTGADILKFVMSVFVVATHTGLFAPHLTPLVRLAVPAFFVLSGYFFFSKINTFETFKDKTNYLKKSIRHNLILYASWFLVLSPLTFYVRDYFSSGVAKGIFSLVKDFFLASTFQSSWYITALIIGLIFVFFMSQKLNNFTLITIGVLFYIPALLSSNYLFVVSLNDTAKTVYDAFTDIFSFPCRNFFVSVIYLTLGKVLAEKKKNMKLKKDFLIFLLCFILLIAEYLLLVFGRVQIKDTDCFVLLPAAAYYLCSWALSLNVTCSFSGSLRKISTISYCAHMAVFMLTGKLLSTLDIKDFGNIIVFALTLVITWAVCLVIIKSEKYKTFIFFKYFH